jgi:hypothetical protein
VAGTVKSGASVSPPAAVHGQAVGMGPCLVMSVYAVTNEPHINTIARARTVHCAPPTSARASASRSP